MPDVYVHAAQHLLLTGSFDGTVEEIERRQAVEAFMRPFCQELVPAAVVSALNEVDETERHASEVRVVPMAVHPFASTNSPDIWVNIPHPPNVINLAHLQALAGVGDIGDWSPYVARIRWTLLVKALVRELQPTLESFEVSPWGPLSYDIEFEGTGQAFMNGKLVSEWGQAEL